MPQQNMMLSQRTIFSLKGTNIRLPNRYKIRKCKLRPSEDRLDPNPQIPLHPLNAQQSRLAITNGRTTDCLTQATSEATSTHEVFPKKFPEQLNASLSKIQSKAEAVLEKEIVAKRARDYHSSTKVKRCACGDCEECLRDFGYFLHIFSDDQSIPEISAKSWCIWKRRNGKFLHFYGKRIHKVRQIASLSKMITAMTAIDFMYKYGIDPAQLRYQIKKSSVMVGGTSAQLQMGQVVNALDLLYGMMLPSGNDAAVAISEAIGLIYFLKCRNRQVEPHSEGWYEPYQSKNYSYLFISLMNEKCQRLGTLETRMFNSHGNDAYDQLKNVSTCNEVARIASEFMNYPLLREIVRTPVHGNLENTNKLLQDGFDGIKTGITETAGPCLAASYKDFIIVVLNSKSMNERWIEVKKLVKWILRKTN